MPPAAAQPADTTLPDPRRALLLFCLFALYVIWGSTYLAIHFALEGGFPPLLVAGLRYGLAGAVLYAFLRLRGHANPSARQWMGGAVMGLLLLTLGNGSVVVAQQWVPSGVGALGPGHRLLRPHRAQPRQRPARQLLGDVRPVARPGELGLRLRLVAPPAPGPGAHVQPHAGAGGEGVVPPGQHGEGQAPGGAAHAARPARLRLPGDLRLARGVQRLWLPAAQHAALARHELRLRQPGGGRAAGRGARGRVHEPHGNGRHGRHPRLRGAAHARPGLSPRAEPCTARPRRSPPPRRTAATWWWTACCGAARTHRSAPSSARCWWKRSCTRGGTWAGHCAWGMPGRSTRRARACTRPRWRSGSGGHPGGPMAPRTSTATPWRTPPMPGGSTRCGQEAASDLIRQ